MGQTQSIARSLTGSQDHLGVGTDAREDLPDEVVGLADEDGFVRVVVAQAEALVSVAPGQVTVRVTRHENLK